MNLSIVIPAYNESNRIVPTVKKIKDFLEDEKIEYEIIVVDDASTDDTLKKIENMDVKVLRNRINRGKGFSVRKGMMHSQYTWALFTDADLSTPIEEIKKFFPFMKNHDIIIGSRRKEKSKVVEKQPLYRVIAGNIFPLMVKFFVLGIDDTQCGFKLFNMDRCRTIFRNQKIEGFTFDVEILHKARKKGLRIKEVGVDWYNDKDTKLNFFKDSYTMFWDLMRIRFTS